MGDSSDGSSSDDGGLRHVTMARARPAGSRRRVLIDNSESDSDSSSGVADNSSIASSCLMHRSVGLSGLTTPNRYPPPSVKRQPPLYRKGDRIQYQQSDSSCLAVIVGIDTTVSPPSYVIKFDNGHERTTEEDRLSIAGTLQVKQPKYSINDRLVYTYENINYVGSVVSISYPSYSVQFEDGSTRDLIESDLQPKPEPKYKTSQKVMYTYSGVTYSADVVNVKLNCFPAQYDVRFEDGQTRTLLETDLTVTTKVTPSTDPPTPEGGAVNGKEVKSNKIQKSKIKEISLKEKINSTKQEMPKPVKMCDAAKKSFPGTKAYACCVIEKISNRGFRHKRLMVLTSALLLFTKEDGEIRRVIELQTIDSIFLQKHSGTPRVLIQLKTSTGEPDVMFVMKQKPDPRNAPSQPLDSLPIIRQVCLARPPHDKVQITEVSPGQELRDLMRVHTEKSNPRAALKRIVKEESRSKKDEYDIGTNEPTAPEWKPDSDVKECEICLRAFTLLRRRHHCRACGGVFCGPCSSNKLLLPHVGMFFYYFKPLREYF